MSLRGRRLFSLILVAVLGCSDAPSGEWSLMSISPLAGRYAHTAVWTGTEMLVWGGFDRAVDGIALGDGGAYDPATNVWGSISPAPISRAQHSAVWTGSQMIVWGGVTALRGEEEAGRADAGGAIYDPASDSWQSISEAPISRANASAFWTGTHLLVWGGNDGATAFVDGAIYSPSDDSWTTIPDAPIPDGWNYSAVWTGDSLVASSFTEGIDERVRVASYQIGIGWEALPPSPSRALEAIDTHLIGNRLLVLVDAGPSVSDASTAIYDISAGTWEPIRAQPQNPELRYAEAVWTGSELLLYGGASLTSFAPGADRWVTLASPPLTERSGHTVVWTGYSLVSWGGRSLGEAPKVLADGATFRP